jgi:mannosyl-3-phosphoglycerate phosphatase
VSPLRRLVATDLDGCLLDEETHSRCGTEEALSSLRRDGVGLVLCSSKTRAEMAPLAADLGFGCPFIVENGGALVIPEGALPGRVPGARREPGAEVLVFGVLRDVLVRELAGIAARTGAEVRGFSSLSTRDLQRLTGLPRKGAERALDRDYDEPFLLAPGSRVGLQELTRAAQKRGLRVTRGGRFLHLTGTADKGYALSRLLGLYAFYAITPHTVGVGDCENDIGLLETVERPILIPRPRGGVDPSLRERFPDAEVAPEPGPRGWNRAILRILAGGRLPTVPTLSLAGRRA